MSALPEEYMLLTESGIDAASGLKYCNSDWDFYVSILQNYLTSHKERSLALQTHYASQAWKDYEVIVHALKSTSKTIGAAELSKKAELLEKAVGDMNIDYILNEHTNAMKMYDETVENISAIFPEFKDVSDDCEDILEFLPDTDFSAASEHD